jgi:hypothetical protein
LPLTAELKGLVCASFRAIERVVVGMVEHGPVEFGGDISLNLVAV